MNGAEERALRSENQVEVALAALYRSVAAGQFYPPDHPVLADALRDGYRTWCTLEGDERWTEVGLQLKGGTWWFDDAKLDAVSPALISLARTFAAHGVVRLRLTAPLPFEGFTYLASLLAAAPDTLLPEGGLPARWRRSSHAEALELHGLIVSPGSGATAGSEDRAAPPSGWGGGLPGGGRELAALSDPLLLGRLHAFQQRGPRERRVLELLLRLGGTDDIQAFLATLREINRHVRSYLEAERFREAFHVILFLYREAQNLDALGHTGRRDYLLDSVRLLVRGDFLRWLIAHVASAAGDEEAEIGEYILRALGKGCVVPLLNALVAEKSRIGRRRLVDVLVSIGEGVVPSAVRLLEDQRWYVVRNMVTILGGVGSPEAVKALLRVADDPDPRLRREVARALGRAPGEGAEARLIRYLDDPDAAVRLMAASAAGSHGSPAMLRALCRVYGRIGLRSGQWALKGVLLQAMGRTGLPEAGDLPAQVLRRQPLFRRRRWRALQRAAIQALGHLGGDRARELLEPFREHRTPELRRAALRALALLEGHAPSEGTP